jgi:thiamine-phosphate pyrophosphorylase
VHLGRHSVTPAVAREWLAPATWLSRSCHSLDDIDACIADGVALAVLCPIHASPGKPDALGQVCLIEALRRTAASGTRVLALGGLDKPRAEACLAAGAAGVASIRGDLSCLL